MNSLSNIHRVLMSVSSVRVSFTNLHRHARVPVRVLEPLKVAELSQRGPPVFRADALDDHRVRPRDAFVVKHRGTAILRLHPSNLRRRVNLRVAHLVHVPAHVLGRFGHQRPRFDSRVELGLCRAAEPHGGGGRGAMDGSHPRVHSCVGTPLGTLCIVGVCGVRRRLG